jgi:hypothetical protein
MNTFVMPIIDGRRNFGADSPWQVVAGSRAAQMVGFLPPSVTTTAGPPARARVNHNRWIADCPDCGGAEFVWRHGPLVMLCLSCLNGGIGHVWRTVTLPDDVEAIEAALAARPVAANRNWDASERIDDLLRENAEHGV